MREFIGKRRVKTIFGRNSPTTRNAKMTFSSMEKEFHPIKNATRHFQDSSWIEKTPVGVKLFRGKLFYLVLMDHFFVSGILLVYIV